MSDKFPKSKGGLWINVKKTAENHPTMTGNIEITPEQLKVLVTLHRNGVDPEKIKLQLGAWTRTISQGENKGDKFQYLRADAYYPSEFNYMFEEGGEPKTEIESAPKPESTDDTEEDFPF